jgi:hypothetical protein
MRKRIAGIAALATAVAFTVGIPAVGISAPPTKDYTGKACMDIFVFSPSYTSANATPGETAIFQATLTTPSAPSCAGAVYTITVEYTDTAGNTFTKTTSFIGDGSTAEWPYSLTIENAPATICVSATSRPNSKSNAAADRAPDAGCATLTLSRSGGASGFG